MFCMKSESRFLLITANKPAVDSKKDAYEGVCRDDVWASINMIWETVVQHGRDEK